MSETITSDYWTQSLVSALETQRARAPAALAFRAAQIVLGTRALFSDQFLGNLLDPPAHAGRAASEGVAEDQRDRKHATELDQYYDDVIAQLKDATSILIFGPGEAKGEFKKRLEHKGADERIVGVETTDKMTDNQIAAKVREHYAK